MERVKVVVHGALGKMGHEVLSALCRDPELEAVAGVDIKAEDADLPLPDGSGSIPFSADLESILSRYSPDVLVDFTTAVATMPAVRTAVEHDVRLVIGTTGLSPQDLDEIKSLCQSKQIGAVVAPNFSLAAVVMIHLAGIAARFFDYAEIIEMHHEQKADAPSGTALATAREMVESRGRAFLHVPARSETIASCRGGEFEGVALHSVRLPGMLAHQEIVLGAPGETLRLRLDQISREAFMPCITIAIKKVVELTEAVFGLNRLLGLEGGSCRVRC
jgi:4-hydroxy-tetrahydrodipicolinate reductase